MIGQNTKGFKSFYQNKLILFIFNLFIFKCITFMYINNQIKQNIIFLC